jgi:hypothetical protein
VFFKMSLSMPLKKYAEKFLVSFHRIQNLKNSLIPFVVCFFWYIGIYDNFGLEHLLSIEKKELGKTFASFICRDEEISFGH